MSSKPQSGYILAAVLSFLSFLTVLVLGFFLWAKLSIRISNKEMLKNQSQHNAICALSYAVGELQRSLGSDNKICARSEIAEDSFLRRNRSISVWSREEDLGNLVGRPESFLDYEDICKKAGLTLSPDSISLFQSIDLPKAFNSQDTKSPYQARYAFWIEEENTKGNLYPLGENSLVLDVVLPSGEGASLFSELTNFRGEAFEKKTFFLDTEGANGDYTLTSDALLSSPFGLGLKKDFFDLDNSDLRSINIEETFLKSIRSVFDLSGERSSEKVFPLVPPEINESGKLLNEPITAHLYAVQLNLNFPKVVTGDKVNSFIEIAPVFAVYNPYNAIIERGEYSLDINFLINFFNSQSNTFFTQKKLFKFQNGKLNFRLKTERLKPGEIQIYRLERNASLSRANESLTLTKTLYTKAKGKVRYPFLTDSGSTQNLPEHLSFKVQPESFIQISLLNQNRWFALPKSVVNINAESAERVQSLSNSDYNKWTSLVYAKDFLKSQESNRNQWDGFGLNAGSFFPSKKKIEPVLDLLRAPPLSLSELKRTIAVRLFESEDRCIEDYFYLSGGSDSENPYYRGRFLKGGFNVNSVSVKAWKLFIGHLNSSKIESLNTRTGEIETLPVEENLVPLISQPYALNGEYETLGSDEIEGLAENIVLLVRREGPFSSIFQFMKALSLNAQEIGIAPEFLYKISPFMTVRSDTFRVQAYGEVFNPVINDYESRALVEALVERFPDSVFSDEEINPLGRKFRITQLRWIPCGN